MECSLCGGICYLLGRLGNLVWFRCRHCGLDHSCSYSVNTDTYEVNDDET